MKLKAIVSSLMLCVIPTISSYALANNIIGKVELKKVTLFLRGAELQGISTVTVPEGESEIILTNLANTINVNSINVGLNDKAMILSTSLVDDYLVNKVESESIKSLQDSLAAIENDKASLTIKLTAVDEEVALLQGNRIDAINKANGTLADAKQALAFVKENLIVALTEKQALQQELSVVEQKINQYQSQISLEKGDADRPQKAIKVKIYAKEAASLPVSVSYVSPDAGWEPIYDVRVRNIGAPLNLTYKANVYQSSGLSWNNIDFILSTANPSEGITSRIPNPWYIYLDNYTKSKSKASSKNDTWYEDGKILESRSLAKTKDMSLNNYIVINNNGINSQFNINLPYTINGYSKDNILTLKEKEVSVEYHYIASPKLDNYAFLQAEINDWDKLSLLPGKSTVFYNGNYIGESYITTQGVKDKLNISLGRDKEILISRNQDINETSKPSFFGGDVSQKFAYTIDIRNTKDLSIDLTIYDQFPVIRDRAVTLEDTKYSPASYDKDTGLLAWKFNLKPKEVKVLPFSFKISYPKDKIDDIIGL